MSEEQAELQAQQCAQAIRPGPTRPGPVRLWVKGMVTEGKFGFSFAYRKDVGELIAERLPKTLFLALTCHFISTVIGIGLGISSRPENTALLG